MFHHKRIANAAIGQQQTGFGVFLTFFGHLKIYQDACRKTNVKSSEFNVGTIEGHSRKTMTTTEEISAVLLLLGDKKEILSNRTLNDKIRTPLRAILVDIFENKLLFLPQNQYIVTNLGLENLRDQFLTRVDFEETLNYLTHPTDSVMSIDTLNGYSISVGRRIIRQKVLQLIGELMLDQRERWMSIVVNSSNSINGANTYHTFKINANVNSATTETNTYNDCQQYTTKVSQL